MKVRSMRWGVDCGGPANSGVVVELFITGDDNINYFLMDTLSEEAHTIYISEVPLYDSFMGLQYKGVDVEAEYEKIQNNSFFECIQEFEEIELEDDETVEENLAKGGFTEDDMSEEILESDYKDAILLLIKAAEDYCYGDLSVDADPNKYIEKYIGSDLEDMDFNWGTIKEYHYW